MRVMTDCNSHVQRRQQTDSKDKGFADMLAGKLAHRHDNPEAAKNGVRKPHDTDSPYAHPRCVNPHRHHSTEGTLKMGRLTLAKTPCTAELVESEPFVAKPTYPASIYDIPASQLEYEMWAAHQACSDLDTEGMSQAEIYNCIESIYKDFLGKDFKEPMLIYGGVANDQQGSYEQKLKLVEMYFGMDCRSKGVNISADPEILREARGYQGMSESEMRAAVREQYPEVMTAKDCILMANELWELGLTDGNYGYHIKQHISLTTGIGGLGWNAQAKILYDIILSMSADLDSIKASQGAFVENDFRYQAPHNMDNVLADLLSLLGGSESTSPELLEKLRALLDEMEKLGLLYFDQFGYVQLSLK